MINGDDLQPGLDDFNTNSVADEENVDAGLAAQSRQNQNGATVDLNRPQMPLYYARRCLTDLFMDENELRVECFTQFSAFAKNLKQEDRFDYITGQLLVYLETRNQMETFWVWLFNIRPDAYSTIGNYKAQWERAVHYYKSPTSNGEMEPELQPGIVQPAIQDPTHPLQSGDKLKIGEWFFETLSRQEQSLAITVGLFGGMKLDYLVELSQTIEIWLFNSIDP